MIARYLYLSDNLPRLAETHDEEAVDVAVNAQPAPPSRPFPPPFGGKGGRARRRAGSGKVPKFKGCWTADEDNKLRDMVGVHGKQTSAHSSM